jgi:hypothetical protein
VSEDNGARATIAEDRVRELELERDKWKDAFNESARERARLASVARRLEVSKFERATYQDAESPGEARAFRQDEHLCNDCLHSRVCEVASTIARFEVEAAGALFRCALYVGPSTVPIEVFSNGEDSDTIG